MSRPSTRRRCDSTGTDASDTRAAAAPAPAPAPVPAGPARRRRRSRVSPCWKLWSALRRAAARRDWPQAMR